MSLNLHRRVEDLMGKAERLEATGQRDEARRLYLEAAELEAEVFGQVPATRPRTRGVVAVSTASLFWRAGAQHEVERVAREYLAFEDLPEFARVQLGDLLANRDPMLRRAIPEETSDEEDSGTSLEVRSVRGG